MTAQAPALRMRSRRRPDVEFFVGLMEAREPNTRGHCLRVAGLSRHLVHTIGEDRQTVESVERTAMVHDVGKMGIPEAILSKPAALTFDEFETVKRHPVVGAQMLHALAPGEACIASVLSHHERWDGRGYPHGLRGDEIPLAARVIAIADAYDAMVSDRPYRSPSTHEEALAEIRRCAGTQFDPGLARAFCRAAREPGIETGSRSTAA